MKIVTPINLFVEKLSTETQKKPSFCNDPQMKARHENVQSDQNHPNPKTGKHLGLEKNEGGYQQLVLLLHERRERKRACGYIPLIGPLGYTLAPWFP